MQHHQHHHRRHRNRFHPSRGESSGFDWNGLAVVAGVILTGWGDCFSRPAAAPDTPIVGTPTDHLLYGLGWYFRYAGRFLVKCLAVLTLPVSVWLVYRMARKRQQEIPAS